MGTVRRGLRPRPWAWGGLHSSAPWLVTPAAEKPPRSPGVWTQGARVTLRGNRNPKSWAPRHVGEEHTLLCRGGQRLCSALGWAGGCLAYLGPLRPRTRMHAVPRRATAVDTAHLPFLEKNRVLRALVTGSRSRSASLVSRFLTAR